MNIERRVLKSISEFSMFKYFLFFYLLFFILSVIVMVIAGLLAWLGFNSAGIDINDIFEIPGIKNTGIITGLFGGGMAITIIVVIIGGLVVSVVYAAVGTIMIWIMNVVLKMSGGIELRFLPEKKEQTNAKISE
ncbi:MAG: hypothetical protein AVO38_00675 [delta proteobacterium ML8_D]|jgi:hypothetical protein|nr:MAG: hypothetical protein AVO38_00675 [delta proteobacterium ML8_D]